MTYDELINILNEKIESIDTNYEYHNGYNECVEYLKNNICIRIEDFKNIDIIGFMKCFYTIKNINGKEYNYISNIIDKISDFLLNDMSYNYEFFLEFISYINEMGEFNNLIDILSNNNPISSAVQKRKLLSKLNNNYSIDDDDLSLLIEVFEDNKEESVELIKLFKEDYDTSYEMIEILLDHYLVKTTFEEFDSLDDKLTNIGYRKKHLNKAKVTVVKNMFDFREILNKFGVLSRFVADENDNSKRFNKDKNKEIKKYKDVIELLKDSKDNLEITNARAIISNISDGNLKNKILRYIYDHNMEYYSDLKDEYEKYSENSEAKFLATLNKFGLNISQDDVKYYMNNSVDDVFNMLNYISKLSLDDINKLYILKYSNIKTVSKIIDYIMKGFIKIDTVKNNIDLFNINIDKFNILESNILSFNNYNINPSLFNESSSILFGNNEIINNNLLILDQYYYLKNINTASSYNFLIDKDLINKIDKLIESGYEMFIEKNLDLLNSPYIKRLDLLKLINLLPTDMESLREVLTSDKFIVEDEKIDSYILNILDYKDKIDIDNIIDKLNTYKISPRSYNINGHSISINKVNRLLNDNNSLYDSLFYNMVLTEDEYNEILDGLNISNLIKK